MGMSIRKKDDIVNLFNGMLVDLPSPASLSYMWNFGSLLGLYLVFQIVTGLMLAIQFTGDTNLSFYSLIHLMRDVDWGWVIRVFHANGASFFFLLMYFHIGRGMYYMSYENMKTWMSGVSIFLLSMATAFLGYVLPWGQMSFWAATVITNLLSVIPYIGGVIVEWLWGGFAVGNPTLIRFFGFHFIFPFIILFFVLLHLMFLHESGSSNVLGLSSSMDSVYFHPYYIIKDVYGLLILLMLMVVVCFEYPYMFMDVENFIESNPLVTPVHIQPEWYFLFAYAILRSIPNKVGGVIALVMSIFVLYSFSFIMVARVKGMMYFFLFSMFFWWFVVNWLLLTWIGACEVIMPYSIIGAHLSFLYFFMIFIMWLLKEWFNWVYWL